jgi:hypothetical protein
MRKTLEKREKTAGKRGDAGNEQAAKKYRAAYAPERRS